MERYKLVALIGLSLLMANATLTWGQFAQYYSTEVNREIIKCKMCPPGTFWNGNCYKDGGQAICKDCPDGRFTNAYNREIYCRRCTKCNGNDQPSGEVMAEACTRLHDTKCECKPGYWREKGRVGDCREVSPCKPRYGVNKIADSHNNTTCERCVNGKTFSNISSEVATCQNCSVCPEGWAQKTPCNESNDTVCIPKDEAEYYGVYLLTVVVVCGPILILCSIVYCCREKIKKVLHESHCSPKSEELQEYEVEGKPLRPCSDTEMLSVETYQDNGDNDDELINSLDLSKKTA